MPETYKYKVLPGQNTVDIAMRVYGSAEAVFDLCSDNSINVGEPVTPGTELIIDPEKVIDKRLVHYYTVNNTIVASE